MNTLLRTRAKSSQVVIPDELKKSFVKKIEKPHFDLNKFLAWHHAIIVRYQPVDNPFYNN